jgi:hypothetical protein
MIVSWRQSFSGEWRRGDERGTHCYEVTVEVEGPTRAMMTDPDPIEERIAALDGQDLSAACGRSTLEAITIHLWNLVEPMLDEEDRLKRLYVCEDGVYGAELGA